MNYLFASLPNVVLTPHITYNSREGGENMLRIAYATFDAFLKAERLHVAMPCDRTGPAERTGVIGPTGLWLQSLGRSGGTSGLTEGAKIGWGFPLHFTCQYVIGTEKCPWDV